MKKGIIVNLKRFRFLDYVNNNKSVIVLCVLFIIGTALGSTIFLKSNYLSQIVNSIFKKAIQLHRHGIFVKKFFSCFLRYFLVLLVYFVSGASMLGIAVIPLISLWQGIFLGNQIAHLYNLYSLNGIAFNAIIALPPITIFVVCCFFAAKQSINFSLCMAKLTLPKYRPISLYNHFKTFCGMYLSFIGISVICTFIEIILNLLFLKYFDF